MPSIAQARAASVEANVTASTCPDSHYSCRGDNWTFIVSLCKPGRRLI
jgi:hypothetical protein